MYPIVNSIPAKKRIKCHDPWSWVSSIGNLSEQECALFRNRVAHRHLITTRPVLLIAFGDSVTLVINVSLSPRRQAFDLLANRERAYRLARERGSRCHSVARGNRFHLSLPPSLVLSRAFEADLNLLGRTQGTDLSCSVARREGGLRAIP